MKVYKFKFTKLTLGLIYAGLALAVAAFGVTLYLLLNHFLSGDFKTYANMNYRVISYAIMIFVSVLLFVILVSLLISSYYSLDDEYLKTSFGIIKSKFKISDIKEVILDRTINKLAVYFSDENFMMIVVKQEWYDDFISRLLHINPQIEYSVNSKENSPDDNTDK